MIIAFGARRTWISFVITQQTMYRTSGVKLFIRIHGKGRRDLSAVHSMRMSVGNGGPARGQVRKLWRRPGNQAYRDYRNCCKGAASRRHWTWQGLPSLRLGLGPERNGINFAKKLWHWIGRRCQVAGRRRAAWVPSWSRWLSRTPSLSPLNIQAQALQCQSLCRCPCTTPQVLFATF